MDTYSMMQSPIQIEKIFPSLQELINLHGRLAWTEMACSGPTILHSKYFRTSRPSLRCPKKSVTWSVHLPYAKLKVNKVEVLYPEREP